jgi:hypothetical protein
MASGNQSNQLDLQLNGSSVFRVLRGGAAISSAFVEAPSFVGPETQTAGTMLVGNAQVVADAGVIQIGVTNSTRLVAIYVNSDERTALVELEGVNAAVTIVHNAGSLFSTTEGNAGTVNIYWHAGSSTYRLQNKRGSDRTIRVAGLPYGF